MQSIFICVIPPLYSGKDTYIFITLPKTFPLPSGEVAQHIFIPLVLKPLPKRQIKAPSPHLNCHIVHLKAVLSHLKPVVEYLKAVGEHLKGVAHYLKAVVKHLKIVGQYLKAVEQNLKTVTFYLKAVGEPSKGGGRASKGS